MIHTRAELIDWIRKNVNDRVLTNAIETGSVEVLGGFDPLPTSTNPGWMVKVKSPFGRTHLIAIGFDLNRFQLYWFRAPNIPWDKWAGVGSESPLYAGDNPTLYAELKVAWEGHDPRFTRISRCTELCAEEDGGPGEAWPGQALADRDVPPSAPGQSIIHDEKDHR